MEGENNSGEKNNSGQTIISMKRKSWQGNNNHRTKQEEKY
jgi:hypothetical protein